MSLIPTVDGVLKEWALFARIDDPVRRGRGAAAGPSALGAPTPSTAAACLRASRCLRRNCLASWIDRVKPGGYPLSCRKKRHGNSTTLPFRRSPPRARRQAAPARDRKREKGKTGRLHAILSAN